MTNKKWQHLQPGDIVDIVAPAGKTSQNNVELAKKYLEAQNLVPRVPNDLFNDTVYSFSNTDQYRFNHLKNSLLATDSKAVWCIRGGYGSTLTIEDLMNLPAPEQAKLLIGFSDITAIHIFLQQFWHWNSVHGNVLNYMTINMENNDQAANKATDDLIFGRKEEVTFSDLKPLNTPATHEAVISNTTIIGGNLSLLQASLGTDWQIDTTGKILLMEEVREAGYRVHRTLNQLKQAHVFDNAKAIIFGNMCAELDDAAITDCEIFVNDYANRINIPVVSYTNIGHDPKHNEPVPFGSQCVLVLGEHIHLTCDAGFENFKVEA